MTPKQLNAAMPLGVSMSTHDIQRALEHVTGRPILPNAVSSTIQQYPNQIEGGAYTTRWRQWRRVADIPDEVTSGALYPCEVRTEYREVPLTTKSAGSVMVRITLPREPWVTA